MAVLKSLRMVPVRCIFESGLQQDTIGHRVIELGARPVAPAIRVIAVPPFIRNSQQTRIASVEEILRAGVDAPNHVVELAMSTKVFGAIEHATRPQPNILQPSGQWEP